MVYQQIAMYQKLAQLKGERSESGTLQMHYTSLANRKPHKHHSSLDEYISLTPERVSRSQSTEPST